MSGTSLTIEQALHCAKCNAKATIVEECTDVAFSPDEVVLIKCPIPKCRQKPWFYCKSCKKKQRTMGLLTHATRNSHIEAHAIAYPNPNPPPRVDDGAASPVPAFAFPGNDYETANADMAIDDTAMHDAVLEFVEDEMLVNNETLDDDFAQTYVNDGDPSLMDVVTLPETHAGIFNQFPVHSNSVGNEWLLEEFDATKRANPQSLGQCFGRPELQRLKNFWVAELGTGPGRCGGGLMYLAARAFQQTKDSQLNPERYPEYPEAKWHFESMIQYQSMTEKQRLRNSRLLEVITDFVPPESFFKHSHVPKYKELGKYYGGSGQHSMWNNLPTPTAIEVDGVAYVGPRAIVAYAMANGVPVDKILIRNPRIANPSWKPEDDPDPEFLTIKVEELKQCRKSIKWMNSIRENYYDAPFSNLGAPNEPAVGCVVITSFKDGFGASSVKTNRDSIDAKSCTVSPAMEEINSVNNTFPVAIGLKKAKGWETVERMWTKEIAELTGVTEPTYFYHGPTEKVLPWFLKDFAVIADRAERPGLTGSLGFGSDTHRCFTVSGKIQTPSAKVKDVHKFIERERKRKGHNTTKFGWSDKFISKEGKHNGAFFPACGNCRKKGLRKLGLKFRNDSDVPESTDPCPHCLNWELMAKNPLVSLDFPVHDDYPSRFTEGSPVPPPEGRNIFTEEKGHKLPFVQLDWALMIQACKFAFYQASRPKRAWTKAQTMMYLKYCGVSLVLAESLHNIAKACATAKHQDSVDYDDADGVFEFKFPGPWLAKQLCMRDYIEAIMHQLFLGVAESNFEIGTKFLSKNPAAAKMSHAPFLQCLQKLITDLRPFMLSWLLAYPLTGKKGKLGTGSWVSENWIFFIRVSQFVFGWCTREYDSASKYGVDDLSRMVIAYHAFVARCLTHNGIDDALIAETELYMKEFLSAVREFDIRVRYEKLNKPTKKPSERKGTEAWWLKPNYMSLCNLISMMLLIGPLVLWWDGGGKGERFIQMVKPHIQRGVRDDVRAFFVTLLEKLYQVKQMELLDKRYSGKEAPNHTESDAVIDILGEIADLLLPPDEDTTTVTDDEHETTLSDDDEDKEIKNTEVNDAFFTASETHGMTKKKTIYMYRNERHLDEAIADTKPLAGIVEVLTADDGKTAFEFRIVYRKPVKQLARRRVRFDDANGVYFNGMWCAPIVVDKEECVEPIESSTQIQTDAKLSGVAIPLQYIYGEGHEHSKKYCVITNWWKYRTDSGSYSLPSLDPALYDAEFELADNSVEKDDEPVEVRGGNEYAEI